ncbi:MAG TPA: selenide, water dikinase SelD, partial [Sulfurimonas sp.]|nr:selenide, water dikinase SelD [Sulfurimonas sp.]
GRNFESYGHKIGAMTDEQRDILCDAQTSGGLLCVVEQESVEEFLVITKAAGFDLEAIGKTVESTNNLIEVI